MSIYLLLFEHYEEDEKQIEGDNDKSMFYSQDDKWVEDPENPSKDISDVPKRKNESEPEETLSEPEVIKR